MGAVGVLDVHTIVLVNEMGVKEETAARAVRYDPDAPAHPLGGVALLPDTQRLGELACRLRLALGLCHSSMAGVGLRDCALGVSRMRDCHVIPFSGWTPNAHWIGSLAALIPLTE